MTKIAKTGRIFFSRLSEDFKEICRCFRFSRSKIIKWKWWFIQATGKSLFSFSQKFMHHQQKVQNNKINLKSRLLSSDKAKIARARRRMNTKFSSLFSAYFKIVIRAKRVSRHRKSRVESCENVIFRWMFEWWKYSMILDI